MSELSDISRFRWLIAWLANNLVPAEIHKIKTLLKDQLRDVDTGDGALGIFDDLVNQNRIHDEDTELLRMLFGSLGRKDLEKAVDCYETEKNAVAKILKKNSSVFGGPFFGRQDILNEIVAILDTDYDHIHAICITGEEGIGKTRMAQEACARTNGSHKLITVDLRGLQSMKSVYFAILHAFGVESVTYELELLFGLLRDYECSAPYGNTILLLDNANSVMDPGSVEQPNPAYKQFVEALRTITSIPNPRLKVVMTSQYHLDIRAGLRSKVVNGFRLYQHNGLDTEAVIRMFRYHAGNTAIAYEDAEDVIKMCGTNPLAIKVIANRLQDGCTHLKELIPSSNDSSGSQKADLTKPLSRLQITNTDQLYQCLRTSVDSLPEKHKLNIIRLAAIPGYFTLNAARKILKYRKKNSTALQYDLEELKYLGFLQTKQVDTSNRVSDKVWMYSIHLSLRAFIDGLVKSKSEEYLKVFHKAQKRFFQFYGKELRSVCKMTQVDLCNALSLLRQDSANYLGFLEILKSAEDFKPSGNLWVIIAAELLFSPQEAQKFYERMAELARERADFYAFADLRCYEIRQLKDLRHDPEELLRQLQEIQDILDKKIDTRVDTRDKHLSLATLYCSQGELLASTKKTSEAKKSLEKAVNLQKKLTDVRTAHHFLMSRTVNSLNDMMKAGATSKGYPIVPPATTKTFFIKTTEEDNQESRVQKDKAKAGQLSEEEESSSSCSSTLEAKLPTKKKGKATREDQSSSEDESSSSCSDTLEVKLSTKKKGKANVKAFSSEEESSSSCSSDLEARLPARRKATRPKQDPEDNAFSKSSRLSFKISDKLQGRVDKNLNHLNRQSDAVETRHKPNKEDYPSAGSGDSAVDSGSLHSSDEMATKEQKQQALAYHY